MTGNCEFVGCFLFRLLGAFFDFVVGLSGRGVENSQESLFVSCDSAERPLRGEQVGGEVRQLSVGCGVLGDAGLGGERNVGAVFLMIASQSMRSSNSKLRSRV